MRFKSIAVGLALALLMSTPLATEARVYEKEASTDCNTVVTMGSTGEWFLWDYKGLLSGIRTPASEDPWA